MLFGELVPDEVCLIERAAAACHAEKVEIQYPEVIPVHRIFRILYKSDAGVHALHIILMRLVIIVYIRAYPAEVVAAELHVAPCVRRAESLRQLMTNILT